MGLGGCSIDETINQLFDFLPITHLFDTVDLVTMKTGFGDYIIQAHSQAGVIAR